MLTETTPSVSPQVCSSGDILPSGSRRTYTDLRALDRALVQADLPAARAAFHRLQEDSPLIAQAASRDPFPVTTRPLRALRTLGRCLMRGKLTAARQAFEFFC